MIKRILTAAAFLMAAAVNAPAHADVQHRPYRHPCETEGSYSCTWDAEHMGNHRGQSFWVDYQGYHHTISHARAHHRVGMWFLNHGWRPQTIDFQGILSVHAPCYERGYDPIHTRCFDGTQAWR